MSKTVHDSSNNWLIIVAGRPFDAWVLTNADGINAYGLIRHPLYASLLAFVWYASLKEPSPLRSILLALSATCFLLATSVAAKRENLHPLHQQYEPESLVRIGVVDGRNKSRT